MAKKDVGTVELKVIPEYDISVCLNREITLDAKDKMTASVIIKKLTDSPNDLENLWDHATALIDSYFKKQGEESEETVVEPEEEESEEQEITEESINAMGKEELIELCSQIPELEEIDTKVKEKTLKALIIDKLFSEEETTEEETPEDEEEQNLTEEIIENMSKEELIELCSQIPELEEIDTKVKEKTLKALIIDKLFSEEETGGDSNYKDTDWDD